MMPIQGPDDSAHDSGSGYSSSGEMKKTAYNKLIGLMPVKEESDANHFLVTIGVLRL
jgi:hypothetical protein